MSRSGQKVGAVGDMSVEQKLRVELTRKEAEHFLRGSRTEDGDVTAIDGGFIEPESCEVCASICDKLREALASSEQGEGYDPTKGAGEQGLPAPGEHGIRNPPTAPSGQGERWTIYVCEQHGALHRSMVGWPRDDGKLRCGYCFNVDHMTTGKSDEEQRQHWANNSVREVEVVPANHPSPGVEDGG